MADFEPYSQWLGIDKSLVPPNYYQLLGIDPSDVDDDLVRHEASQLTSRVRSIRPGEHAIAWTRVLDEIDRARKTLSDPALRKKYDLTLTNNSLAKASLTNRPSLETTDTVPHGINKTAEKVKTKEAEFDPASGGLVQSNEMLPPSKSKSTQKQRFKTDDNADRMAPTKKPLKMAIPLESEEAAPKPRLQGQQSDLTPPSNRKATTPPAEDENDIQINQRKRKPGIGLFVPVVSVVALAAAVGGIYFVMQMLVEKGNDETTLAQNNDNGSEGKTGHAINGSENQGNNTSNQDDSDQQSGGYKDNQLSTNGNGNLQETRDNTNAENSGNNSQTGSGTNSDNLNTNNGKIGSNNDGTGSAVDNAGSDGNATDNNRTGSDDSGSDIEGTLTEGTGSEVRAPAVSLADKKQLMMLFRRVHRALSRRDTDLALRILEKARTLPSEDEQKQMFVRLEEAVELSEKFWSLVAEYLPELRGGNSFTFGENVVGIVETNPAFLTIRQAGKNRRYYLDDMPSQLAVAIVDNVEDSTNPDWKVVKSVYYWSQSESRPELLTRAREFLGQVLGKTETENVARLLDDQFVIGGNRSSLSVNASSSKIKDLHAEMLGEFNVDSIADIDTIRAGTFADLFFTRAFTSDSDDERFASFLLAKECAVRSNDFYLSLDVVSELSREFQVDYSEEVAGVFRDIALKVRSDQQARKMFMEYVKLDSDTSGLSDEARESIKKACLRVANRRRIDHWIEYFER